MPNIYENLDLRYPYIGTAMDPIYRPNPGTIRFQIDFLTPTIAPSTNAKDTNTPQKANSSTLANDNINIGVSKITTSNYISINVPKELTAYLDGTFNAKTNLVNKVNETVTDNSSNTYSLNISSAEGDGIHSHSGSVTIGPTTRNFVGTSEDVGTGTIQLAAIDNTIPKGSKWIIMFIAGDINKPVVIARYYG